MHCMVVCARALRSVADASSINADLRKKCHALVTAVDRVSARLRSHFRHICGDSSSHGKAAWEQVQVLSDQCKGLSEEAFDEHVAVMKRFAAAVDMQNPEFEA
eukprot:287683-Pyramimonas_sp.AAC.1